jgi:pimeloyl-ACP methyl ester carboxylesterase
MQKEGLSMAALGYQVGVIPPEPPPKIPDGNEIILYLHGGPGSRLEEAGDLVPQLHAEGLKKGKKYTVIAFDQPSQGYSSMIDAVEVVPPHDKVGNQYPLVQFSEDFIVHFVDALDKIAPIKHRNIYIIGGSTGGALTLRMGHRQESWIKKIVAWNPASVWETYADDHDLERKAAKGRALYVGFERSKDHEDTSVIKFGADDRKDFFNDVFGAPVDNALVKIQPNPEEWYRGNRGDYKGNTPPPHKPFAQIWPCKWDYIGAARLEMQEVYNPAYRSWHWRLGTEMLLFSFFNDSWVGPAKTGSQKNAVYLDIRKPTLLAASEDDDWSEGGLPIENRWTQTQKMAQLMTNTPGYTLYLPDTGHSIHNERPIWFAEQIVEFLSAGGPAQGPLQVRGLSDEGKMQKETCASQLAQFPGYPRIPGRLLNNGDAETRLFEPANLGGKFKNGKNAGEYSLRLHDELRKVVAKHDARFTLSNSAEQYYKGDAVLGQFFAELAVTGRGSYESFRSLHQKHPTTEADVAAEIRKIMAHNLDETKLQTAIRSALTRAYEVVWALRNPDGNQRHQLRRKLGWLACSGEDDPPARPVNAPSGIGLHPQYELPVTMPGTKGPVTFQVRYTIANP